MPPRDSKGPPKGAPKPDGTPVGQKMFEEFAGLIFVLLIVGTIYMRISDYLSGSGAPSAAMLYFDTYILPILRVLSVIISAGFAIGIGWVLVKYTALNKEVNAFFNAVPVGVSAPDGTVEGQANRKWARIQSHLNSSNPNDWKFAILEADIMLSDLLDQLNYPGTTMADKLKAVNPGDFKSIEAAWEAHKIRNTVAHEGADYVLSEREAHRVIGLYASVFQEFKLI